MLIETARLQLVPYSPQDMLNLIDGYEQFERSFGLPAAQGLREFFVSGDVSPDWVAMLHTATTADPWLFGFAVIHRESRSVIGTLGFKGPPDDAGMVEIAYGIVPDFQRQGFATEAAMAGYQFAVDSGRVCLVRAHTLPTGNASTRVLAKCGFEQVGEVVDPDDGLVWRWERSAKPQ